MKILKKNQIIIFVIAFMLIAAGYLNYTTGDQKDFLATSKIMDSEEVAGIGDAKLVSSNSVQDETNVTNQEQNDIVENNENVKEVSNSNGTLDDYFISSKIGRDTMY